MLSWNSKFKKKEVCDIVLRFIFQPHNHKSNKNLTLLHIISVSLFNRSHFVQIACVRNRQIVHPLVFQISYGRNHRTSAVSAVQRNHPRPLKIIGTINKLNKESSYRRSR